MSRLSTKHAVLGLMIDRPSYGYRLQQEVAERLGFLDLANSAIYKILERLEQDGLVEETGQTPVGRTRRGAPRVLYQATARGEKQFAQWIAQPSARGVLRDELQAKLAVSRVDDLPQLLAAAEQQTDMCIAELSRLKRPPVYAADGGEIPWPQLSSLMVDDFHARWLECLIGWLEALCEVLESRIESSPKAKGD